MRIFRIVSPLLVFTLLVALPLLALGERSTGFSPTEISPLLSPVFFFTLKQALLSVGASILLGALFVLLAQRRNAVLEGLLLGAFSVPSLCIVGLFLVLGRFFELDFGLPLLIGAHAYLNAPWIALALLDARATFPRAWADGARSLGASRREVFFRFELPWTASRLGIASAQVFAFCVMSFTLVLLLGGGPPVSTLETEIYAAVRGGGLNLGHAAQFAGAQLLLAAIPLILTWPLKLRNLAAVDSKANAPDSGSFSRRDRVALLVAVFWLALPLMVLGSGVVRAPEAVAFFLTPEFLSAFGLSLWIATLSAALALGFALLFAAPGGPKPIRLFIRTLAAVPIGLSPLTLSLGFLFVYSVGTFSVFDPFEGSVTAIVLIHAVLLLPFGLRFLGPLVEEGKTTHRRTQRFAARSLGAGGWSSFWKTEWPHYRKGVTNFLRVAWVWSFADLAVVSFFGSEKLTTLPVLIARQMGRYAFDVASATLFFVTLLSVFVLFLGRNERGRV